MQPIPWNRIGWYVVIWAVIAGLATLAFLSNEVNGDAPSVTIDIGVAQNRVTMMATPGPWNSNHAWSQGKVNAKIDQAYAVFWPEARHDARPYALVAAATLLGGSIWITLASWRRAGRRRGRRTNGTRALE